MTEVAAQRDAEAGPLRLGKMLRIVCDTHQDGSRTKLREYEFGFCYTVEHKGATAHHWITKDCLRYANSDMLALAHEQCIKRINDLLAKGRPGEAERPTSEIWGESPIKSFVEQLITDANKQKQRDLDDFEKWVAEQFPGVSQPGMKHYQDVHRAAFECFLWAKKRERARLEAPESLLRTIQQLCKVSEGGATRDGSPPATYKISALIARYFMGLPALTAPAAAPDHAPTHSEESEV